MKQTIMAGLLIALGLLLLTSCTEKLFKGLAKDKASACGYSTVTYGAGAIMPAPTIPVMGVYVHQHFCRSNSPGSVVKIAPDGTISVQHAVKESVEEKKEGPTIR